MYKNTGCSCPAIYLRGPSRLTTQRSVLQADLPTSPKGWTCGRQPPFPCQATPPDFITPLCFMTPPAAHYTDSPEKIGTKCSLVLLLTDGRTGNHTAETQPTQPGASHCASTAQRCFREDRRQRDSTNIDTAVHQPP